MQQRQGGLDDDTTAHLLGSAAEKPRRRRRPRRESVQQGIAVLPGTLALPAFVGGRHFDVLAAIPLAAALSPRFRVGRTRLRDLFLDPAERDFHPDRDGATARRRTRERYPCRTTSTR